MLVVGALGAVSRLIAPLLQSKQTDPAVLVLDADGQLVVPLLGGHQAGAEALAQQLAELLGAQLLVLLHLLLLDSSFGVQNSGGMLLDRCSV